MKMTTMFRTILRMMQMISNKIYKGRINQEYDLHVCEKKIMKKIHFSFILLLIISRFNLMI